MFFRSDFFADPAAEIARDAALFRDLEQRGGPETLRFWECRKPAVIVGSLGTISREVHENACLADDVPIIRRISGGGAVVLGEGCLNYSLVLSLDMRPDLRQVKESYRFILTRIINTLGLPLLALRGLSDLTIGEHKVSGNAQRRGRRALLHHGTLLYDFDIRLMARFLTMPGRQPAYRGGRSHGDFVANLPLAPDLIMGRLARAWQAESVRT